MGINGVKLVLPTGKGRRNGGYMQQVACLAIWGSKVGGREDTSSEGRKLERFLDNNSIEDGLGAVFDYAWDGVRYLL